MTGADPPTSPVGHLSYRCPHCGAAQALEPGTDALACGHCGHQVPIDTSARAIHAHDFAAARGRARRGPAGAIVRGGHEVACRRCGARSITIHHAGRCPFCDEPLVTDVVAAADAVLPDAVLPFAIGRADAARRLTGWLTSRWFAPRDLVRRARRDGMDGVYVPYWIYDSDTTTRYTGARGAHHWVTEEYRDANGKAQTRQVRRTRWHPAAGTVQVDFDDVLVPASRGLPRDRLAQLAPWQLGDLQPFDGGFLAGFVAECYSVNLDDGFTEAAQIMERHIDAAVRDDIGGDEQRVHDLDVHHADVRFKHVLLPVWVSSFRYRHKLFRVVVNARTGEVAGDRPWSVLKIVLFVLAVAAAITAIVLLVSYLREPVLPPDPEPVWHSAVGAPLSPTLPRTS